MKRWTDAQQMKIRNQHVILFPTVRSAFSSPVTGWELLLPFLSSRVLVLKWASERRMTYAYNWSNPNKPPNMEMSTITLCERRNGQGPSCSRSWQTSMIPSFSAHKVYAIHNQILGQHSLLSLLFDSRVIGLTKPKERCASAMDDLLSQIGALDKPVVLAPEHDIKTRHGTYQRQQYTSEYHTVNILFCEERWTLQDRWRLT